MTETITIEEYRKLHKQGRVKSKGQKSRKYLSDMKLTLQLAGIEFVEEHRFHPVRKFRFDIAILEHKIGIEYDGIFSDKSRHTTVTGFSKDQEKINLATSMGWKVLRYSPLNYTQMIDDVRSLLNLPHELPATSAPQVDCGVISEDLGANQESV